MRFKKIVTSEITAEVFNGNDPEMEGIKFRYSLQDSSWQIYNELHDSWINIKTGDYFRTDVVGDHYPIDKDYMKANYEEIL